MHHSADFSTVLLLLALFKLLERIYDAIKFELIMMINSHDDN